VHRLEVKLGERTYPIVIGPGPLSDTTLIHKYLAQPRAMVVTNTTVAPLFFEPLATALRSAGVEVLKAELPDGERYKTWDTLNLVFDDLLKYRCERKTTIIALGGGVVGDIAGFAAASYQRGVPFIQVPTTLLSQVDSSVGGKTGINHPLGKNMIGAFYQPRLVIADTDTLKTLPLRELRAGLAEVIKYGLIWDAEFFAWIEQNLDKMLDRDPEALAQAVRRSCEIKALVVAQDERETGVRALLNLGHTFGHAIEAGLGFGEWLHGEAVAAGMVMAARLSQRMGDLSAQEVSRIECLLARTGLPVEGPRLGVDRYLELMGHDKKVEGGRLRLVLCKSLGRAHVSADFPRDCLESVLAAASA